MKFTTRENVNVIAVEYTGNNINEIHNTFDELTFEGKVAEFKNLGFVQISFPPRGLCQRLYIGEVLIQLDYDNYFIVKQEIFERLFRN